MTPVDPLIADLRARRQAAGLSLKAVAEAAGISAGHWARVELGHRVPTIGVARRMGQVLGLQPGWVPLGYEADPAAVTIERVKLQALFDLAVHSMDFGSGFWSTEDTIWAREVAVILGLDPMEGTPSSQAKDFGHQFVADVSGTHCYHCASLADARWHVAEPDEDVSRTLHVAEQTAAMAREAGR